MHLRSGVRTDEPGSTGGRRTTTVATASRPTVVYHTLRKIPLQVRLLEILPPISAQSNVNCRLSTVSLDDSPDYVALSYVWGDPIVTGNIRVNNCVMSVTTNLESALRQIRATLFDDSDSEHELRGLPSRFWIDAVCINSKDKDERSHQVQIMRTIYQQASLVLTWLGPPEYDLVYGMVSVDMLGQKLSLSEARKRDIEWMSEYPEFWDIDCSDNTLNKAWNTISRLHSLDYWSRVWTLQERVLAKRLWFMVGPCVVDGNYFEEVMTLLENIQSGLVTKPTFVSDVVWGFLSVQGYISTDKRQFFKRITVDPGEKSEALEDFFVTYDYKATDPRDKIYAVLGLFDHLRNDVSLLPDYTASVESLYCGFGRAYVRSTGNHELLCYSGLGYEMPVTMIFRHGFLTGREYRSRLNFGIQSTNSIPVGSCTLL